MEIEMEEGGLKLAFTTRSLSRLDATGAFDILHLMHHLTAERVAVGTVRLQLLPNPQIFDILQESNLPHHIRASALALRPVTKAEMSVSAVGRLFPPCHCPNIDGLQLHEGNTQAALTSVITAPAADNSSDRHRRRYEKLKMVYVVKDDEQEWQFGEFHLDAIVTYLRDEAPDLSRAACLIDIHYPEIPVELVIEEEDGRMVSGWPRTCPREAAASDEEESTVLGPHRKLAFHFTNRQSGQLFRVELICDTDYQYFRNVRIYT